MLDFLRNIGFYISQFSYVILLYTAMGAALLKIIGFKTGKIISASLVIYILINLL